MRRTRTISAVLLVAFSVLLAGNMMGYVLCQRAITQETTIIDCGCDDLLNTFSGQPGPGGDVKSSFKTVSLESIPSEVTEAGTGLSFRIAGYHAPYQFFLPQGNSDAVFHPPAV